MFTLTYRITRLRNVIFNYHGIVKSNAHIVEIMDPVCYAVLVLITVQLIFYFMFEKLLVTWNLYFFLCKALKIRLFSDNIRKNAFLLSVFNTITNKKLCNELISE